MCCKMSHHSNCTKGGPSACLPMKQLTCFLNRSSEIREKNKVRMLNMQLLKCENTCESRPHEDSEPTYRAVRYKQVLWVPEKVPTNETPFRWSGAAFFYVALSHETVFSSRQQVDTRIVTANHAFNKIQGGHVVTSGVALTRRATFSSFRTTKFFTMLLFARVWGVFLVRQQSLFCEKYICVFIINGPKIVGILCFNGHIRIHTRTPKNTTLHHPSVHSDTDTDQKHHKSLHFLTHLDQPRNCLYLLSRVSGCALLNLCWSTKEWVVAALGRRWTWRLWRVRCLRASRRVPSPKIVGGQAAVFVNQARRPVATLCRWEPTAFWRQSSWTRSASSSRKSMGEFQWKSCQIASHCLVPAVEKPGRRPNATLLFGIHHAKRRSRIVTSLHFWATFHDTSLPGRVYLSMDTPSRDVAYGALSPELSPNDYCLWVSSAIQGASAWSSCLLSARSNRCVISSPWLTLETNCTWHVIIPSMHSTSRSGHTPNMWRRIKSTSLFWILRHEGHISTIFPVLIVVFVPYVTTRPPLFCDLQRRNNATSL